MRVLHRWGGGTDGRDSLLVRVGGHRLAAPLVERLLELPLDIWAGTLDGELLLSAHDDATWSFPQLSGKVACRGACAGRQQPTMEGSAKKRNGTC